MILSKKLILGIFFLFAMLSSVFVVSAYVESSYSSHYNNAMGLGVFSGAQSLKVDESMCQQGTDFLMQIAPLTCTPVVVRSDLLEEENVRVFCQLSATQINPFVDVSAIKWITFDNEKPKEVSGIGYQPAQAALGYALKKDLEGSAILENLGYIVITLKQQKNESALKNCEKTILGGEVCWVEGNLTAELTYDVKNSFGVGNSVFYLPVINEEEDWEENYVQYSFWEGRGFLRAESVGDDDASISIYSDDSVAKGLSKRDRGYKLSRYISNINLKKGEKSERIFLPGVSPCLAGLELTLKDIQNPETRATLKINEDSVEIADGEKFLDNKCKISSLDKNGINSEVTIKCNGADISSERKEFTLRVSPKVNLTINGETDSYKVGEWLYKTEDGEKSIYLGYVGTEGETTNVEDLYIYLVALPVHKENLDDLEITSVASYANEIKSTSDSGAQVLDAGAKFSKYIIGKTTQFGKWIMKGQSLYDIYYDDKAKELKENSIVPGEDIEGKYISLNGFAGAEDIEFITDDDSKAKYQEYYEKAIDDFETVVNSFSGEMENEDSLQTFGEQALYEEIVLANAVGKKKTMLELCDKFQDNYPMSYRNLELCEDELHISNSEMSTKEITINGITRIISFEEIKEPSVKDYSAKLIVEGPNGKSEVYDLTKNKPVQLDEFRENSDSEKLQEAEYIMLESLEEGSAEIRLNVMEKGFDKAFSSNSETFRKDIPILKSGYTFTLTEINLNKVAQVSVNSITDFAKSETSFKFKIGIEKRAIQLSPSKAQGKIESLDKSIENWQKASDALYGVVKTMKTACLGAGAVLTFKNFVANYAGKSIARDEVMNGKGGWEEKCAEMPKYKSLDACFLDNADEIENDVDELYDLMKYQNDEIKEFENSNMNKGEGLSENYLDQADFIEDYSEKVRNTLNSLSPEEKAELGIENMNNILTKEGWESNQYTIDQLREIELYALYLQDSDNKDVAKSRLTSVLSDVSNNAKNYVQDYTFEKASGMGENSLVDSFDKIVKMKEMQVSTPVLFKDTKYFRLTNIESSEGIVPSEYYAYAIKDRSNSGKEYLLLYSNPKDGIVKQTYEIVKTGEIESLKLYRNDKGNLDENPFDLYFKQYDRLSYKNEYKSSYASKYILLKYYETSPYKGLPAVVPFDIQEGWYAGIKNPETSYDLSGVVKSFWVCNVGANKIEEFALQGFGDDICQLFNLNTGQKYTNFPGLTEDESYQLVVKANNAIQEAQRGYKEGGSTSIPINGRKIKVGEPAVQNPAVQCTDFMSPKDCSLLFNLCDPVICPSSRCDLGGNYPVQNVVQSGIIGSIALCYPNAKWNGGDVYIPVCLTGIQAGMDSWLSIQKSYRDCLQTGIATGETLGICDEINSIYTCEFFWKQALPIINSALPKLLGVLTGQNTKGGGEYQGISSALETASSSIDYFKQYYAEDSYRAFKVRSTEEVGTELCSSFISATYPDSGSFLDNLIEPDSPIQFTGKFDENQLTTATNPPTSHYKVYYHIYSGKDSGAYYKVYLRGSGSSYYRDTSQSRLVGSGYISRGGYTSNTTDFTAPSGYKELCIVVNGQEECGFKEVSTSFAVNYVENLYLAEQASKTDIKTEKECISGTASLYSFLNLNAQSAAENLLDPAIYSQGIIRICATDDPGIRTDVQSGKEGARWQKVGYCGDSKIGCWIDTDSVKDVIKVMNIEDKALGEVSKGYIEYLSDDYLTSETFASKLKEIKEETSDPKKIELIDKIIEKVFFNNQRANLFFLRGKAYSNLAINDYVANVEEWEICPHFCGIDGNVHYGIKYPENISCEISNLIQKNCKKGCDPILGICNEDLELNGNKINTTGEVIETNFDDKFNRNYRSPWFLFNDKNILTFTDDKCYRYFEGKWQFATDCDSNKNSPWYNADSLDTYPNPLSDEVKRIIISLSKANGDYISGLNALIYRTTEDDKAELSEESYNLVKMDNNKLFTVKFENAKSEAMKVVYYKYEDNFWHWKLKDSFIGGGIWQLATNSAPGFNEEQKIIVSLLEYSDLNEGAAVLFDYTSEDIQGMYKEQIAPIETSLKKNLERRNQEKLAELMKSLSTTVFKSNFKCYCGANCEDYAKWITESSESYNIPDELLLLAIMIQESSCKSVESSGGDLGLMQINAKVHCGTKGLSKDAASCKNTLLADKEKNIKVGAQVLKESYRDSEKSFLCGVIPQVYSEWEAALRGYNGWGCTGDNNYVQNVETKYFELVNLYNGKSTSGSSAGTTGGTTGSTNNFVPLNQGNREWGSIAVAPNGNIYAADIPRNLYMQTGGEGNFVAVNEGIFGDITVAPNGNVYAIGINDIYMQTAGKGDFVSLNQERRNWFHMAAAPNGNVYATVYNDDIYMQTGGEGNFVALNQKKGYWDNIAAAPNGNVYATYGYDIYMQTAGKGDFVSLNQLGKIFPVKESRSTSWSAMAAAPNGNVYVAVDNGEIYMQTAGKGDFVSLNQGDKRWHGIAVASNGNVYATVYMDDIYMQKGGFFVSSYAPQQEDEEETPISVSQEIFVVKPNLVQRIGGGTNLYYKYDNGWKWTPYSDYSVWMIASTTEVTSGEYKDESPSDKNIEIINSIENQSYNKGKEILKENGGVLKDGSEIKLSSSSNSIPTPETKVCESSQTKCEGTTYYTCISSAWVNKGKVDGKCGYTKSSTTTPTTSTSFTPSESDCDYEKIISPCTSYNNVEAWKFSDSERKLLLEVNSCDECGEGTFNLCDKEECKAIQLKLMKNCVYTDYALGSGICEEKKSSSSSTATTPVTICTTGQTKCNGTTYYTCTSNAWVNKGRVDGKCGYTKPATTTPITSNTAREKILKTTESLNGAPYIKYSSLSVVQRGEVDKSKEVWTWKGTPIIRDYDNSGSIYPNCFDSVKHVYAVADVEFAKFDSCLKDLIVDVDRDLCQRDTNILKEEIEPGDILSIRYYSENHNVIFVKWIDKNTGKAEIFDWIGRGDKSEFPIDWTGDTKNFRIIEKTLKFDEQSEDYTVYAIGKPVLA